MNKPLLTPQVIVEFYQMVKHLESIFKNKLIPDTDKLKLVSLIRGAIQSTAK
jgi:hypothetical protein